MALVDGKKGKAWKVRFKYPAAIDKNKRTLLVFFAHSANLIAVNFTGKESMTS